MKQSNSLQAALEAAKDTNNAEPPKIKIKKKADKKKENSSKSPPSRKDKVLIAGHFSKDISKQLKFIGVEEEKTNQELLEEALDLLFVKKGKKRLSEL